ncbi:hypothetical protein BDZ91DRAFT_817774 [Kalaharituber pfeilii]|nr:hypothetical protein BDZ91DRAFT_817774 [Kalaharituber pfeilii]
MVRLASLIVFAGSLLPSLVVAFVAQVGDFGDFTSLRKRQTDEELCGAANFFLCSDGRGCCPNGFLCEGDNNCVSNPNATDDGKNTDDGTNTDSAESKSKKKTLSTGAIVGIAIGGVVVIAAGAYGIYVCTQKRKIGKEVLKAYEDPNRKMYDQVVVEGKRVGKLQQQQQQQQQASNLSAPMENDETHLSFQGLEIVGQERQPQLQYYQQGQQLQPAGAYNQYNGIQQVATYEPVPEALRVGSPISPIRADAMGLIPVGPDAAENPQHPHNFTAIPTNGLQQPSSPPPGQYQTSLPPQSSHSQPSHQQGGYYQQQPHPLQSSPPQLHGGYYSQSSPPHTQSPLPHTQSPPPHTYPPPPHQQPGYFSPTAYSQSQQPYRTSSPQDPQYPPQQYQQYPPPPQGGLQLASSSVSTASTQPGNQPTASGHAPCGEVRRTGGYTSWSQG